jgi:hypothetical protein
MLISAGWDIDRRRLSCSPVDGRGSQVQFDLAVDDEEGDIDIASLLEEHHVLVPRGDGDVRTEPFEKTILELAKELEFAEFGRRELLG